MRAVIQRVSRAQVRVANLKDDGRVANLKDGGRVANLKDDGRVANLVDGGRVANPETNVVGAIGTGILTLLGISREDTEREVEWMIRKISQLRVFEDAAGKMNLSLADIGGEHLIVSQFTLYGDAQKGNRPSFIQAASPDIARPLYEKALQMSLALGLPTQGGRFQAHMEVDFVNDGPVTLILDSPAAKAVST